MSKLSKGKISIKLTGKLLYIILDNTSSLVIHNACFNKSILLKWVFLNLSLQLYINPVDLITFLKTQVLFPINSIN